MRGSFLYREIPLFSSCSNCSKRTYFTSSDSAPGLEAKGEDEEEDLMTSGPFGSGQEIPFPACVLLGIMQDKTPWPMLRCTRLDGCTQARAVELAAGPAPSVHREKYSVAEKVLTEDRDLAALYKNS